MQCPGQDSRYWSGEDVFETKCPKCGHSVEFFKDDSQQKCRQCGHRMLNPRIDFGCASYCPYADQCLGSMPPELLAKRDDLFKDKLAIAMRKYFGDDHRRIKHAEQVAGFAEEIGKLEKGNMAVIMAAAYLHDIGIKEAERKFNSSAPRHQHTEGPPVARQILSDLKADPGLIDEVCDIIGHHHTPRDKETTNFKVLYDADLIVNLDEKYQENPPSGERLETVLNKSFLTSSGRRVAKKALMKRVRQHADNIQ
ncbi:MAG: HD domain-containing protein [Desulfobulbaceae bacterium]|nr:HD domain-containing protein [Desulfobulbaceae bacterium]